MRLERLRWNHGGGEGGCGCGGHGSSWLDDEELVRWDGADDDELVCHCAEVTKAVVVKAIRDGAYTLPLLKVLTGLGRGSPCPNNHQCLTHLQPLLKLYGQTTLAGALQEVEPEK